ncbi:AAA family ATPase [Sphingomonas sp. NBWT7]|uniref:ExeA family protein n=1 Tax=Sphingomonas sp. NBWT7 TaxID=2596913 RepID=UPI001626F067|nr:AAA family ATPase [Sphingomonas sp. NBWT7]QNE30719.1 AAA family ATPase [Sphingomonas sp. NBWT7]
MYEEHFGLTDRPFQLTPDPRYWFDSATHRKAMAYLGYGLAQGEGFIVITGDIGAGKTTLVGHVTAQIDPANLTVINIVSTAIEADDLLRTVATGLNVDPAGKSKAELLTVIERGLHGIARTGRRTLLIVDEAQALPVSALEELRMLSNFQAGGRALLQIFLLGQPEFRERLNGSDRLEQLRQRVIAIHHLDPMNPDEIAEYVGHRLRIAGWQGTPDFADNVFPVLYRASGGVPRRLNQLMNRVMLHAAITDATLIDAALINTVRADAARDLPNVVRPAPVMKAVPDAEPVTPDGTRAESAEPAPLDPVVLDRIASLEKRIEEQDVALRRVLTLLVDWVESEAPAPRGGLEAVRGAAA